MFDGLGIEVTFQIGRHLVHAAIARIGCRDDVEAGPRSQNRVLVAEFRDVQHFVAQHADQGVLNLRGTPSHSSLSADPRQHLFVEFGKIVTELTLKK